MLSVNQFLLRPDQDTDKLVIFQELFYYTVGTNDTDTKQTNPTQVYTNDSKVLT